MFQLGSSLEERGTRLKEVRPNFKRLHHFLMLRLFEKFSVVKVPIPNLLNHFPLFEPGNSFAFLPDSKLPGVFLALFVLVDIDA
mmetsp:Transcript_2475/g.2425  ORF Transcript_2475/g.2425 Transcript_2475/m.2425 type:complete len:84 (-) Transcript_2475:1131-1382(-)